MRHKKRLAADLLKTSPYKVVFATDSLDDIKKAITRSDIRGLIAIGKIKKSGENLQSKVRARKIASQKRKGRQKGRGSKKGSKFSVLGRKTQWIAKIRVQRRFLRELKERGLVNGPTFRHLYSRSKGGFFRNKRHIKLYIAEQGLVEKKQ